MVETLPDPEAETLHHQTDIEFRFEPVTLRAKGYQPVTAIGQRNNEEIGSQRVRCAYEGTHRPFLALFCPFFSHPFLAPGSRESGIIGLPRPFFFSRYISDVLSNYSTTDSSALRFFLYHRYTCTRLAAGKAAATRIVVQS